MHEAYQGSLYKEFLEVYNVIFNEQNREFEKFPTCLSEEEIVSRQRVLKKYHLFEQMVFLIFYKCKKLANWYIM